MLCLAHDTCSHTSVLLAHHVMTQHTNPFLVIHFNHNFTFSIPYTRCAIFLQLFSLELLVIMFSFSFASVVFHVWVTGEMNNFSV